MDELNSNDTARVGMKDAVERYGCARSFGLGNGRGLDSQCEKGRWVSM